MTSPNTQPVFSHQADEEPVNYPATAQDDADLDTPFSAPETPNGR
jgi:hypothetical protein